MPDCKQIFVIKNILFQIIQSVITAKILKLDRK